MEMEMLLPPMQEKTEMEWKPILMVQEMLYMPGYPLFLPEEPADLKFLTKAIQMM
jgi:hypothetical protein